MEGMVHKLQEPFAFVVFGGSGDLSRRKLIPALYRLSSLGYMPEKYAVLGVSRTAMSDEAFREFARKAVQEDRRDEGVGDPAALLSHIYYQAADTTKPDSVAQLKSRLDALERDLGLGGNRLFYLAVAPDLVPSLITNLHGAGMLRRQTEGPGIRVVFEKPFGRDLQSARELNASIGRVLDEHQIFRIDHYLGKETVQNILTFRFGNSIFEPLFNRSYVHHIRISVAETVGMEGRRGAYYDAAGALRDIVQNHALQLLCLTMMESPAAFDAQSIRDEKVKVLRALPVMSVNEVAASTVRGQYNGYRGEEGVDPGSKTETYVMVRTTVENWRWAGVPVLIETGKRLAERHTNIEVEFMQPPLCIFREFAECPPGPNSLRIRIQPDEGISLSIVCKQPGTQFAVQEVKMDFSYGTTFGQRSPEAYERLLLDALRGDASLFMRADEVELAWQFVSAILEGWSRLPDPVFPNYEPASHGPAEARRLLNPTQIRRQ